MWKTNSKNFSQETNSITEFLKTISKSGKDQLFLLESGITVIETLFLFIWSIKDHPKYPQISQIFKKLFIAAINNPKAVHNLFNVFLDLYNAKESVVYIKIYQDSNVFTFIPIIYSIIALKNNMNNPITIMVSQNKSCNEDLANALKNHIDDDVTIETDVTKIIDLSKK